MKNKSIQTIVAVLFPFLAVWVSWVCTAGAFEVRPVFQDSDFWIASIIYWVFFLWAVLMAIHDKFQD